MFDGLKIRNKLVLLVAGPMVIIVLLAGLGASSRRDTADRSANIATLVSAAERNATLVDALQEEAIYSTAYVASKRTRWSDELAEARAATDAAGEAVRGPLSTSVPAMSSNLRSTTTLALNGYDRLPGVRSTVDAGYSWTQVVETYQDTQNTFLIVNETIASTVSDPSVGAKLRTSSAIAQYKATIARQGALLLGARESGSFGEKGVLMYREAVADEQSDEAILNSLADTEDKGRIRDAMTSAGQVGFDQVVASASSITSDAQFQSHEAADIATYTGEVLGALHDVEVAVDRALVEAAQANRTEAERAATFFIVAALIAVLAAAGAAVLLGRRITRPLTTLTEAADRLSNEQMPKLVESLRNPSEDDLAFQLNGLTEIEVSSGDEIGQLASAFNNVQKVAGDVAAEQAALLRKGIGEMFVNLARRNQALLDRQIDFIDDLERAEEDPDQLENLYKLDHLATRMRRNAESLLVLAGAEPPRRRGRPAPLANVVRAALAEVEDFGRIELLSLDEVLVASNAAADIAHLLSELMENATNFSPPETKVEVVGHRTKADGYVVSVTDHGIGMSAEQIAEANELLAKPPVVGLALSRSLGFIVVGRLARRHGIAVKVMASASGGVTAVVTVPPALITDGLAGNAAPVAAPAPVAAVVATPADAPAPALDDAAEPSAPAPLSFDQRPGATTAGDTPSKPSTSAEPAAASGPLAFSPTGPTRRPVSVPSPKINGDGALPTRRLTAAPAPGRNGSRTGADAPADGEAPAARRDLPPPSIFDGPPPVAPEVPSTAEPTEPSEPDDAGDEGLRSDGPPPAVPLPTRSARPAPRPAEPAARNGDRGFLTESEPPRLFGRTTGTDAPESPVAPVPATPPAAATPPLAAVQSDGARLFGGGPEPDGAEPLATRTPRTAEADTASAAAPVVTASGLTKRTPRSAGASRVIPGSDAERGAGATRRSPDEVRNLLSRYRDGQQRARSEPPTSVEETEQ